MDHSGHHTIHPAVNLCISMVSAFFLYIANNPISTNLDDLRLWSSWVFGAVLFVIQVIVNFEKIVMQLKKWFK
jgi:hypothetical protein